jgi:hypothetical protein
MFLICYHLHIIHPVYYVHSLEGPDSQLMLLPCSYSTVGAYFNFDLISGTRIRNQLSSLEAILSQFHRTVLLKAYCLEIHFNIILLFVSQLA